MAEANESMMQPSLSAPIPGQSLTAPLGDRPWQNPSEYNTAEDALEYYIPRLTEEQFSRQLLDTMESGVPLTTIANSLQMASVMEGKHSIDVGILVLPVLMETMAYMGDVAGIEYKMGTELKSEGLSEPTKNKIVQKLQNKMDSEEKEEPMLDDIPTEETTDEPVEVMGGLMARRT
tara:strand:- start:116 stop:643 length:528 start_codon:yes stop_codon:yes gene_type:complete